MLGSKLPSKTPTHSLAAVNTASEKNTWFAAVTHHYSVQNLQMGKTSSFLKKFILFHRARKYFLSNAVSMEN